MTRRPGERRRRGWRGVAALPRRLVAGVLIGIGTIVGAKGERDQHWSIPPTVVSDADEQGALAGGDDGRARPDHDDRGSLPACA